MSELLDPWRHARQLAERLGHPTARLVVVLGAESWCGKCRALRPLFDARAQQAPEEEVWLWLDMEEHAEFIGPYLPPDLPLLLQYEGSRIARIRVLKPENGALEAALAGHGDDAEPKDPGIRARLVRKDWAA